jgi:hypothetical protein
MNKTFLVLIFALVSFSSACVTLGQPVKITGTLTAYRNTYAFGPNDDTGFPRSLDYIVRVDEVVAGNAPPRLILVEFENCDVVVGEADAPGAPGERVTIIRTNEPYEPTHDTGERQLVMTLVRDKSCDCPADLSGEALLGRCTSEYK